MTNEREDIVREFREWYRGDLNNVTPRDIQNFFMSKLKYPGSEPSPITNWKKIIMEEM